MSITSDRIAVGGTTPALIDARWVDGPGGYTGVEPTAEWAEEIRRLARARNATLLAHNYELPAIQDVADHVATRWPCRASPRRSTPTKSSSAVCISWPRPRRS